VQPPFDRQTDVTYIQYQTAHLYLKLNSFPFPSDWWFGCSFLNMASPGRLTDKVAIVTGSSSGLGRAIALLYAKEGAKVVCADLRQNARLNVRGEAEIDTHDLITKSSGDAIFVKTDVGDASQMESLVKAATQEYGRLDMSVAPLSRC
jgi:hypothetical protein